MRSFIAFAVLILCCFATPMYAPTKIAPPAAEAPHPFTIIDTPAGRLSDGTKAVFKLNGADTVIDLRTHNPHKTAQGELPAGMGGGDYTVFFRLSDGTEVEVGPFTVEEEPTTLPPPAIAPTIGSTGTPFTITDPQGRIQATDIAVFYLEGTDPAFGFLADGVNVAADGKTLTGIVPMGLMQNEQHFVSVRPSLADASRFADLGFFVTP